MNIFEQQHFLKLFYNDCFLHYCDCLCWHKVVANCFGTFKFDTKDLVSFFIVYWENDFLGDRVLTLTLKLFQCPSEMLGFLYQKVHTFLLKVFCFLGIAICFDSVFWYLIFYNLELKNEEVDTECAYIFGNSMLRICFQMCKRQSYGFWRYFIGRKEMLVKVMKSIWSIPAKQT